MPGKGKHIYTGKLGEVMQESIQAAMSVVRTRVGRYGIDTDFFQSRTCISTCRKVRHRKMAPVRAWGCVPQCFRRLSGIPVHSEVAMTGEITLRGEVLPIGGLKEKLLAAQRGGLKTVLIPKENEKELVEVPKNIKRGLEIVPFSGSMRSLHFLWKACRLRSRFRGRTRSRRKHRNKPR